MMREPFDVIAMLTRGSLRMELTRGRSSLAVSQNRPSRWM